MLASEGHSVGVVHAVALQIRGWWWLLVADNSMRDSRPKTGGVVGVSSRVSVGSVFSGRSWGVVDGGWESWGRAQAPWGQSSRARGVEGLGSVGGVHSMGGGVGGRMDRLDVSVDDRLSPDLGDFNKNSRKEPTSTIFAKREYR